jgi:nicotinamidase-related amidase
MASRDEPWLVAIDLQEVFGAPESPWASAQFGDAAAGVERMLPAFTGRTLLTRFVAPHAPVGAWLEYYRQWPFALTPEDHPQYRLVDPFRDAGLPVETRATFGKWDDGLAAAIGGSREIVLAGVSTDCCVISTALTAADAGVHVRVVADACAGATPEDHRRALDAMALYAPLIELTTVDGVLAGLPSD